MKLVIALTATFLLSAATLRAEVTPVRSTDTWQRLEGTVHTIDRGQYQIEIQQKDGTIVGFQWTQTMRPFYAGIAQRWRDLQEADAVVIPRSDQPVETFPGPRDWSELSGSVVSVTNKERTFRLRLANRSVVEVLESRAVLITRHGLPVSFNELQPGQTVRLCRQEQK